MILCWLKLINRYFAAKKYPAGSIVLHILALVCHFYKDVYQSELEIIKKMLSILVNNWNFYREWLTPNALQQSITTIQEREDSDNSPLWDITWFKKKKL